MDKQAFLKKLDELITLEEGKQPLIKTHVPATLPFSGLEENKYLNIKKELEEFTLTGEKHIESLRALKDQVLNSPQEEY
jgi:hypothetical protein